MVRSKAKPTRPIEPDDLALTVVALLRGDGHLCNVLTHIGAGSWPAIERQIALLFYPRIGPKAFSKVGRNILELICDGRGVTGPLMHTFFFDAIARVAGKPQARRLEKKILQLRRRMSAKETPVRATRPPPVRESNRAYLRPMIRSSRSFPSQFLRHKNIQDPKAGIPGT